MNDWLAQLQTHLVGRQCVIHRRESDWAVSVVGGGCIALPVPWRIVANGRIAFADEDDAQQFGLATPIDGVKRANSLIGSRSITGISVDNETADLTIRFSDGVRLDAFNNSSGYEGWCISVPFHDTCMSVGALGGGAVSIF